LICLESFPEGSAKELPCTHMFCKPCIGVWFARTPFPKTGSCVLPDAFADRIASQGMVCAAVLGHTFRLEARFGWSRCELKAGKGADSVPQDSSQKPSKCVVACPALQALLPTLVSLIAGCARAACVPFADTNSPRRRPTSSFPSDADAVPYSPRGALKTAETYRQPNSPALKKAQPRRTNV
jgi:hypothetical protein